MTPQDIALVQRSFAAVFPRKAQLTRAFYAHLFRIAPEVRPLFREDLTVQREKLAGALGAVIRNLHAPDYLLPTAAAMAQRHVSYGTRPEHYPMVGAALLAALDEVMGEAFTPEDRDAWASAYATLSHHMIEAAYLPTD